MPNTVETCTCDVCGLVDNESNFYLLGNNEYCSTDCAHSDGWYRCADCRGWTQFDFCNREGNILCEDCSNSYHSCYDCGDAFHEDDLRYDENSSSDYCHSCYRNHDSSRLILDYNFKPNYLFSKMPWENTVYFGIELETELSPGTDRNGKAQALKDWITTHNLSKYIYFKEDGSLSNGIEIVFHPATLQAMRDKYQFKAFLKHCAKLGFMSYHSGRCGLHVHISKKKLSHTSLYRGKLFFYKCQEYIHKLSGRKISGLGYCKFDSRMPQRWDESQNGRYSALNLHASDETLEVRIFRGTLNHDKFIAYLQFCDCFIAYIQSSSIAFYKQKYPYQVWKSFLDFAKQQNKSGVLLKYLTKKGIV